MIRLRYSVIFSSCKLIFSQGVWIFSIITAPTFQIIHCHFVKILNFDYLRSYHSDLYVYSTRKIKIKEKISKFLLNNFPSSSSIFRSQKRRRNIRHEGVQPLQNEKLRPSKIGYIVKLVVRKLLVHARMQQSPRCPSRRRARGIGISTAFFRPDFKGDRARSRTCVRAWTTVKVDEWHSSSHCADVSRKDSTSLSSDCATGRTSFRRAIEIESERGSLPARSKEKWPLDPACRGSRPREPRLDRPLLSSLLWRRETTNSIIEFARVFSDRQWIIYE